MVLISISIHIHTIVQYPYQFNSVFSIYSNCFVGVLPVLPLYSTALVTDSLTQSQTASVQEKRKAKSVCWWAADVTPEGGGTKRITSSGKASQLFSSDFTVYQESVVLPCYHQRRCSGFHCATGPNKGRRMTTFNELGLSASVLRNVARLGLHIPSAVQTACIPAILARKDVIGIARTGSGKTATFALPLVHRLLEDPFGIFALCISPTRELAHQIAEQFMVFSAGTNLRCDVIIGGEDLIKQSNLLLQRPHVIVATPGRLLEHFMFSADVVKCFEKLQCLVLDEADRLLDVSFEAELRYILSRLPQLRQTLLFSATVTQSVTALQSLLGTNAFYYEDAGTSKVVLRCEQLYAFMPERIKDIYLIQIIRELSVETTRMIVFSSTVQKCEMLSQLLSALGTRASSLHSAKKQRDRCGTLNSFKNGSVKILVATDVAARGLDIPDVELVINYDVPMDYRQYIHRVGRTARFDKTGRAVTLVTQYDVTKIKSIEQNIGHQLRQVTLRGLHMKHLVNEVFAARRLVKFRLASLAGFKEQFRSKRRSTTPSQKHRTQRQVDGT